LRRWLRCDGRQLHPPDQVDDFTPSGRHVIQPEGSRLGDSALGDLARAGACTSIIVHAMMTMSLTGAGSISEGCRGGRAGSIRQIVTRRLTVISQPTEPAAQTGP
jgi:hypothetical protein